ncbi:MAG: glycosyltransferase [Salinarimonadaceae bacterium]|nr:MAG: glycosyltransferase [Salinarimonadaceae bacterium]
MKVLLISPYFPPYNAIGAVRTGKLAKHLIAHGHEVRVLAAETPELSRSLPLEIPEESVRRASNFAPDALVLRYGTRRRADGAREAEPRSSGGRLKKFLVDAYYSFVCIPDRFFGWLPPALFAARRLTAEFKPDLVYASAQPYSALLVGRFVARRTGAPFVAEFRDLWSDNHYLRLPRWRAHIDHWLEGKVCRDAAALVTVSEPLAQTLAARHGRPTEVIYNGFDPEDLTADAYARRETFEIIYTGMIYPGRRDPSLLFRVLRRLGDEAAHVRVRFYGRRLDTVRELAEREGVSHLVSIEGEIPYREALARQAAADVLLLLLWDTPEERGVLTGKLFEYLASRRPVLLVGGGDGVAAKLVRERGAGHAAAAEKDLATQMRIWLRQHAEGGVPYLPETVGDGFSREEQFARLSDRLEEIAARRKIRIVTLKLDVGGTERHLVQLLPRLDRSRFQIEVMTLYRDGALEETLRDQGVSVSTPRARFRLFAFVESTFRLLATMRRERSTTFHFWLPEAYLLGGLCGLIAGHRRLMMSRRSLNRYQMRHPLLARLERFLHRRMLLVLGNSDAIARELVVEGVPTDRVQVIKNGLDLEKFVPTFSREDMRSALGIRQDALVFVCVANLIHYKGHADLFAALALARDRIGENWRLLCVGRDDGLGAFLDERARALGIRDNIVFLGSRQDVPDLLQASDISVLASHEEGFANAIIEAMAIGLPTVATAVGGNVEAIEDGRTGLLTPARDPARLADALARLAADPALRLALGTAAREDVRAHRALEACVARYEEAYERVVA